MGRLSTVDLLVLTFFDQLLFKLKIFFTFIQKSNLNEVFNCTDPSPSVGIPWIGNKLCLFLSSEVVVAQFRYGLHFPGSKLIQKVKILKDPCFIPCFVIST